MDYLTYTVLCGIGATMVMDVWGILRRLMFGIAAPDFGLVGRWFVWMTRGKFRHESIKSSPPVRYEGAIGWTTHYLTGIAFAAVLIGIGGPGWMQQPALAPALIVGIATVAAPFLLMQPSMGLGIAASRTPRPCFARIQSLITHAVFGFGLYLSGLATSLVFPL